MLNNELCYNSAAFWFRLLLYNRNQVSALEKPGIKEIGQDENDIVNMAIYTRCTAARALLPL